MPRCDVVIKEPAAKLFGQAKAFKAISYLGSEHALNLAANAQGAFEMITDFLSGNGLWLWWELPGQEAG